MNVREAILKAADHIESHPDQFNFGSVEVPHKCGTPGCAVGWIQHFMNKDRGQMIDARCFTGRLECGIARTEDVFYGRMDSFAVGQWRHCADLCAKALSLYADKYHPSEPRQGIPDSVARIFAMSPAELAKAMA